MAKKKYTTEYFDITPIIEKYPDVTYCLIWGERKDGKSYTGKSLLLEDINFEGGEKFVYMRRLHIHITKKKMTRLFEDMLQKVQKRFNNEDICYDPQIGFYIADTKQVIGYAISIQDAIIDKSIPMSNVKYILFDEFIDYTYLDNEIALFLHAISNICRPPNNVQKIIMLANTINEFCPYFDLFNLNPKKIKQGECYYFKHELGVSGVAYWTPTKVDDIHLKSKHDKYIGFDNNESVNMIMFGEWEYTHANTSNIDGITWNCKRHLIPICVTSNNKVYELSIYTSGELPIAFVRDINTQQGKCRTEILYNLSYDNSVLLHNKKRIVPLINKVNDLVDIGTKEIWRDFILCLDSGRVVFNTIETGSNFNYIIGKIRGD